MANELKISKAPMGVGEQFTLSLQGPVPVGCIFEVYIDDKRVKPGDEEAGLHVAGFAALGQVTLETRIPHPNATVTIVVICPAAPGVAAKPAQIGQRNIGSGWVVSQSPPLNPDRGRKRPPRFDKDFGGQDSQREDR